MEKIKLKTVIYSVLFVSLFLSSCSRNEDLSDVSVISSNKDELEGVTNSKLDKYLEREFVKPYNINIQYRLNDVDTDLDYVVTPAKEEKAIQMINLIKFLCLEAYEEKCADKDFLKKYFPKKIILVGSGAYNDNYTVVLGTAVGGVQITLYKINDIDTTKPEDLVRDYFNTIFHEFSHILHQKKKYTSDYEKISKGSYVRGQWTTYWQTKQVYRKDTLIDNTTPNYYPPKRLSFLKGFVSDYSSKEPNEDFVEVISHYITLSKEQLDERINPKYYVNVGDDPLTEEIEYNWEKRRNNAEGVKKINQKIKIVKGYMKEMWNIDLDTLRKEVQKRLKKVENKEVDLNNID